MRKILIGFVVVAVIAAAAYFHLHRPKPAVEAAYAANREVTVWSTTAQVRSPVATANFGEPLGIMSRYGDQVQVRTATGIVGWVSEHDLLSAEFWQKAKDLDSTTSALPVEAHGHTRVLSNLHLEPGRDAARIRQVNKGVPIELFERRVELVPPSAASPTSPPASSLTSTLPGQEVSTAVPPATPAPGAKKRIGGLSALTCPIRPPCRGGSSAASSIWMFPRRFPIMPVLRQCASSHGSS